nr:hypothetical protein [Kibdelosporangium sp. MJ126-NF4]CTQ98978.1 hypothetical protein [Kibdelosporangium sp. MJ126-NF4]
MTVPKALPWSWNDEGGEIDKCLGIPGRILDTATQPWTIIGRACRVQPTGRESGSPRTTLLVEPYQKDCGSDGAGNTESIPGRTQPGRRAPPRSHDRASGLACCGGG